MANPPDFRDAQWRIHGIRNRWFQDIYPRLMGASWTVTIALAFAAYAGTCLVFAGLFSIEPNGVQGATSLSERLWFSVQTLSTIGYGGMTPLTPWANLLVTIESFIGLAGVAVVTAILYAKFSLPEARIGFSSVIAIHDRDGVPTLNLRLLNERITPILDAQLHVAVMLEDPTGKQTFRRLIDVHLLRDRIPVFVMAFTALHIMDEDSPLRPLLERPDLMRFLIVTLRGVDDITLQPVFARALFHPSQLAFGQGFADMVETTDNGVFEVDASRLSELTPRELTR